MLDSAIAPPASEESPPPQRRRRGGRRRTLLAGTAVLAIGGAGVAVYALRDGKAATQETDTTLPTVAVTRGDLAGTTEADGTLGYAGSMRKQGVDVPDLRDGSDKVAAPAGTVPDPKAEAANAVCRKYAPNQGDDKVSAEEEDAAVKTAECLRKQGINATDPKPGTADISIEKGPGVTNEKIVAAYNSTFDVFVDRRGVLVWVMGA
ncbi:hypothetical protein ACWD6R_24480 [Streptomyces sp. NPDC005151]